MGERGALALVGHACNATKRLGTQAPGALPESGVCNGGHGCLHGPCPSYEYALLGCSAAGGNQRPWVDAGTGCACCLNGVLGLGLRMHDLAVGCQGLTLRKAFGSLRLKVWREIARNVALVLERWWRAFGRAAINHGRELCSFFSYCVVMKPLVSCRSGCLLHGTACRAWPSHMATCPCLCGRNGEGRPTRDLPDLVMCDDEGRARPCGFAFRASCASARTLQGAA